jgi:DNA-binding NarL/FixJ family response regulator
MIQETSVLIVDDHPLVRRGLRDVIAENSCFKIVGEAADGEEALRLCIALKPDIAIVDIDMPRRNGLETIHDLRQRAIVVKTIVLTMYNEEDMFNAAMDLGAKAYVLKENAACDIIAALEKVTRGEAFLSTHMLAAGQRRSQRVRQLLIRNPEIEALTPAERRILKLVGEDYTSKEIAQKLELSIRTVENHRQHICTKLKLRGTHSLLKFAFENSNYL